MQIKLELAAQEITSDAKVKESLQSELAVYEDAPDKLAKMGEKYLTACDLESVEEVPAKRITLFG